MPLTEDEKQKCIADLLYNQHKSYRKINKEYGFSFNEISAVKHKIEKARMGEQEEEKKHELIAARAATAYTIAAARPDEEQRKEQQQDKNQLEQQNKKKEEQQQQHQSTKKIGKNYSNAVAAYRLFYKGKKAVQVAIELNLSEPKVTQYKRQYWKLNGLDKLDYVYDETNGNIDPIIEIHTRMKQKDTPIEKLFEALEVILGLQYLRYMCELREKKLQSLENQIEMRERYLKNLNNEIAATSGSEQLPSYSYES